MVRRSVIALAWAATGCAAEPPAFPATSDTDDAASGTATVPTSVGDDAPPGDDDQGDSSGGPIDPDGSASDGSPQMAALMFLESGPIDLGEVTIGQSDGRRLSLLNTGSVEAVDLLGDAIAAPFAWAGGAYPGQTGTCGDTLAAGESCEVEIELAATRLGPSQGVVSVSASNAAPAAVTVQGDVIGTTANLVVNGDAEMGGAPPTAWTQQVGDGWSSVGVQTPPPHGGMLAIWASSVPLAGGGFPPLVLSQSIDISNMATAIEDGGVGVQFSAWIVGPYVDAGRFSLRFRDENGAVLSEATVPAAGAISPAAWQQVQAAEWLPQATRTIEVEIYCYASVSETDCNVYFDDIELFASYPFVGD